MKLLIDIGNTSAKLMVADGGKFVHFEHKEESWTEVIGRLIKEYPLESCVISNVADEDETLKTTLGEYGLPTLWLTDKTECLLKRIPKGYGADRIAADLGALAEAKGRTILVVDAGTCITYDLINREGEAVGGVISAGMELRLKAMHEHTALLPLLRVDDESPLMGNDTHTSMMSSVLHGVRFEVEGYIRTLTKDYPDLIVYMTGGNIIRLADDLGVDVVYEPDLLFKGLNNIR